MARVKLPILACLGRDKVGIKPQTKLKITSMTVHIKVVISQVQTSNLTDTDYTEQSLSFNKEPDFSLDLYHIYKGSNSVLVLLSHDRPDMLKGRFGKRKASLFVYKDNESILLSMQESCHGCNVPK